MYTPSVAATGPRPFLCNACLVGVSGPVCACGWETCDCGPCRGHLAVEWSDPGRFMASVVDGTVEEDCVGSPGRRRRAVSAAPMPQEPAEPAEPPAPPAPEKVAVPFRALLRMCGLSHAEAAVVLGQSESAIKKKSAGSLAMTSADHIALRTVWNRICNGDLGNLLPGSVEAAAALRALQD